MPAERHTNADRHISLSVDDELHEAIAIWASRQRRPARALIADLIVAHLRTIDILPTPVTTAELVERARKGK